MKAALVIMAAGMGSRYGGNKQVDGVGPNGEILMEYSIYDAVRAGFDKVVFIIKPEMEPQVRALCGDRVAAMRTPEGEPVEVCYTFQDFSSVPSFYTIPAQRVKPFGTCHALLCARQAVKEPFVVINADDYYGVEAFPAVYEQLQKLRPEGEACMVGYLLKNTISENGTVSRGVCQVENGRLQGICETLKIKRCADGKIRDTAQSEDGPVLAEETPVSMNFWGFTPWIFEKLETYFNDFLHALPPEERKAECLLPVMVGQLMQRGELSVEVLRSAAQWFGVTYREDKPLVQEQLRRLHERGVYPPSLKD